MENLFIGDWKQSMLTKLKLEFPNLTDTQILSILDEDVDHNFYDPQSSIHNDYNDDMLLTQPLSAIYRFSKEKQPILAGNGTLFFNQDKQHSPIADVIDDRINTRAMYKGEMKKVLAKMENVQEDTPEYNMLNEEYEHDDMMQAEAKIRINSIYGSFGAPTFQLYNKYTAAATTGTAQSLISATGISFEAFIGNHVKFKSFDECVTFIQNTITEDYELSFNGIAHLNYTVEVLYQKMVGNFAQNVYNTDWDDSLVTILSNIGSINLVKLYYKNNLMEFIECPRITEILVDIFNKLESFDNPNKVPSVIKEDMELLWIYCREFVFYNYAATERIRRLKHDKREVVKLIDTDSNLIHVQPWVDKINEVIIPETNTRMDKDSIKYAGVNSLAYLVTSMLKDLLSKYCTSAHVLERYHPRINMKNEFCFAPLLLAPTKKRYVGKMVLREGNRVNKVEIKGHDFKKAGISEWIRDEMENIIGTCILDASPTIDIPGIMCRLVELEASITQSLTNGERRCLTKLNCKQMEAYKNPYSMPQVLSVLAWNIIYPEQEIKLPDKLDVVLTTIKSVKDIEIIRETFPYEYDRIKTHLLEGSLDVFREKGVRYIAIPNSVEEIPEFIRPFINYEQIKMKNLSTFSPITKALGQADVGSSKNTHFSNIRKTSRIEI